MSEMGGYLGPGERVIWQGQPQQGVRFAGRDLLLIPFSVVWTGVGVAIPVAAILNDAGAAGAFVGIGVLFATAGLYVTVGRFFHDAWLRSRTRYALTDRRALILRGDRLTSVTLATTAEIGLKGGKDGGRGTVLFGPEVSLFSPNLRLRVTLWLPSLDPTPQFIGIERARWVFDQAQTASRG